MKDSAGEPTQSGDLLLRYLYAGLRWAGDYLQYKSELPFWLKAQGAYIVFANHDVFALSKGGAVAVTLPPSSCAVEGGVDLPLPP